MTINLPEKYLDAIQILNDQGIYASRSEAIRIALEDFLKDELDMFEDLDPETFKKLINSNHSSKPNLKSIKTEIPETKTIALPKPTTTPKPKEIQPKTKTKPVITKDQKIEKIIPQYQKPIYKMAINEEVKQH